MRSTWESSNYITNQQPIAASPTMLGIAERSSSLRREVLFSGFAIGTYGLLLIGVL